MSSDYVFDVPGADSTVTYRACDWPSREVALEHFLNWQSLPLKVPKNGALVNGKTVIILPDNWCPPLSTKSRTSLSVKASAMRSAIVSDINAARKRKEGLKASYESAYVPEFCERCWHRPYNHRRGLADCGLCGCKAE